MAGFFELVAYRGRTTQHKFTLYQEDGSTGVSLDDSRDIVRFKMGRGDNKVPDLDLDNVAKTANGSNVHVDQFTAPAEVRVTLAQADLDGLDPGTYDAELTVIDDSVASPLIDPAFVVNQGVVLLVGAMAGDIGKT